MCCGAAAGAAELTLPHLFPVAGAQGTTVSVTAAGKLDAWPSQVWVDAPGITFHPSKTKWKFDVEIAADAAPGPHLVRIFNEKGALPPRFFIVSREPETLEVEPNDDFRSPQKVEKLPATINGRLDKPADVDSFAVTLKKGETLTAKVEAYVLASAFDGMLRIVDPDGNELAFNHDDGRTLDPLLVWPAPRDGTFIVQVMGFVYPAGSSVALAGGEGCVYRLHLTTGVAPVPRDSTLGAESAGPKPEGAAPPPISIPGTAAGCIRKAGDEDRIAFTAVKKCAYEFNVIAERTGSALDAWLKIENQERKELARNDDAEGSHDPRIAWTAPSDGVFFAAIGDVTHHGGPDYVYRLTVSEAIPAVTGMAVGHAVSVTAGKTAEVKVAVKRVNGFKTKLQLAARGLPEKVSAPEVEVPEKDGDVTLKFVAEAGAAPVSQTLQLVLREAESGTEHVVPYFMSVTGDARNAIQGFTDLVIDSTDQLWLTVIAAPPKTEPPPATSPPPNPRND